VDRIPPLPTSTTTIWRISTDGTTGSPTYGQVIGYQGNYPFGESWYSNNGNEFVFTSYQRDSESGLDYAMARYYDSTAARFCSADPLGGQLDDPQTWNRYSYSRNDPINLVDPSGKGFLSWFMDALLVLADIFSGGATIPESVEWGISMQGIGDLATVAAIARQGMSENPQGQKQSIGQSFTQGPRDEITASQSNIDRFYCLWKLGGYGALRTERSMWITRKDGEYGSQNWPWSAQEKKDTWTGKIPDNTVAQAHTHPDIGDPKPSTGNEKGNDDYAANQIGRPIYTVTRHAIWRQDPQKKDPVQAGEDGWWKVSAQKEKNKELKCP
jgi:RHS repeat-associated protein